MRGVHVQTRSADLIFAWTDLATWLSEQGVQAARTGGVQLQEASYTAWAGREQRIGGVPVAAGERARRELWVPQMSAAGAGAEWTGSSKRPRAPPPYSYW